MLNISMQINGMSRTYKRDKMASLEVKDLILIKLFDHDVTYILFYFIRLKKHSNLRVLLCIRSSRSIYIGCVWYNKFLKMWNDFPRENKFYK